MAFNSCSCTAAIKCCTDRTTLKLGGFIYIAHFLQGKSPVEPGLTLKANESEVKLPVGPGKQQHEAS